MGFQFLKSNRLITIILVAIIVAGIAYPSMQNRAYYERAKVANPYSVPSGGLLFSLAYYKVMHEASLGNYSYASSLLNLVNKSVNIQEVKGLIKRFNSYMDSIITLLNETRGNLTLGYHYLKVGNLSYAYKLSTASLKALKRANASTIWLSYLASTIKNSIGPYFYLEKGLKEIKGSEGNLTSLIKKLRDEIYSAKGNVSVSVWSNTSSAWLGNVTSIYGRVTFMNSGLANATVMLAFENYSTNVTTNSTGYFSVRWKIPYIYKNRICVYAYFIPNSIYRNLKENSSSTCINLIYFRPRVELRLNSTMVLPGSRIKVYGSYSLKNISSNFNQSYIYFFVSNFNQSFYKSKIGKNGTFSYALYIPNVKDGTYTITAVVPPHKIYYEAKAYKTFTVYRIETKVSARIPWLALAGGTIKVQGKAYCKQGEENQLRNSSIIVYAFNRLYFTRTNSDGTFLIKMRVPLFYMSLSSPIVINVKPSLISCTKAQYTMRLTVINPLPLALGLAALFGGSKYVYDLSKRGGEGEGRGGGGEGETPGREKMQKKYDFKREEIRKAFEAFTDSIKLYLGISLEDYMTLREYFTLIKNRVKGREGLLDTIVNMLEKEVYGSGLSEEERDSLIRLLSVRIND